MSVPTITKKQAGIGTAIAAMIAVATPIYVGWEGEKLTAYKDVVGVVTVCSGDTRNVHMGMKLTPAQCKERTKRILEEFGTEVAEANPSIATEENRFMWAAHTIHAANIGTGNYRKGSVLALDKAGRHRLACRKMRDYKYAGGRVVQGLINRRNGITELVGEYELCLADAVRRDIEGD